MLAVIPLYLDTEERQFWLSGQGCSLLFRAAQRAGGADAISSVVVCTDDDTIARMASAESLACKRVGPECFTTVASVAVASATLTASLGCAPRAPLAMINFRFPYIEQAFINRCAELFADSGGVLASIQPPESHPGRCKSYWEITSDDKTLPSSSGNAPIMELHKRTPGVLELAMSDEPSEAAEFRYRNVVCGDAHISLDVDGGTLWRAPGPGELCPVNLATKEAITGRQGFPPVYRPDGALCIAEQHLCGYIADLLHDGRVRGVAHTGPGRIRVVNTLDCLRYEVECGHD